MCSFSLSRLTAPLRRWPSRSYEDEQYDRQVGGHQDVAPQPVHAARPPEGNRGQTKPQWLFVFTTEELAPRAVMVATTGVSNGDLLRGARFLVDSARTDSLVICTRCNWVRVTDGIHFFVRERREEVWLLGYPGLRRRDR